METVCEFGHLDQATGAFLRVRPRLFGVAYRILRNAFEAEDAVQDTWLRWQGTERSVVANPEAFLVTTTTRLALNQAQSAWHRRETPTEEQSLERREPAVGPQDLAERRDAVERAVSLMLATLTATERAVYVLREGFDYDYERIAELLGLRPANCRQLVRRARLRLVGERRRPVSAVAARRLVRTIVDAAQEGAMPELEQVLAHEANAGRLRVVSQPRVRRGLPEQGALAS